MNRRVRAEKLLEFKERGYSVRGAFKKSAKLYALLIILGALFACFGFAENEKLFVLIAGISFGTILRDYGWFKAVKQGWPFTVEITDWDKVEQIANEKRK